MKIFCFLFILIIQIKFYSLAASINIHSFNFLKKFHT